MLLDVVAAKAMNKFPDVPCRDIYCISSIHATAGGYWDFNLPVREAEIGILPAQMPFCLFVVAADSGGYFMRPMPDNNIPAPCNKLSSAVRTQALAS
jgi:hypothetical protein